MKQIGVLLAASVLIGVSCPAGTVQIQTPWGELPVVGFEQHPGSIGRLDIRDGVGEIHASDTLFIAHGWGKFPLACSGDLQSAAEFAADHLTFRLTVNGRESAPTLLNLYSVPDEEPPVGAGFISHWVFEFSPGYFEPGIHILEGHWLLTVPCSNQCVDCTDPEIQDRIDEDRQLIEWGGSKILTLTVLP
ncbi:hypothetical protein ACFLSW_03690 [Candidatus Bipolaricaulota bacterium]